MTIFFNPQVIDRSINIAFLIQVTLLRSKFVNNTFSLVFPIEFNSVLNRLADMTTANVDSLQVNNNTWTSQIKDAMNVNGGDIENATTFDYVMHFLTFGWKV